MIGESKLMVVKLYNYLNYLKMPRSAKIFLVALFALLYLFFIDTNESLFIKTIPK